MPLKTNTEEKIKKIESFFKDKEHLHNLYKVRYSIAEAIVNAIEKFTQKSFEIEEGGLEDLFDSIRDDVIECIYGIEIVYFDNAISYLADNDPSLQDSVEIAQELGYTIKDINSELLATLLNQQRVQEEYTDIEEELMAFLVKENIIRIKDNDSIE